MSFLFVVMQALLVLALVFVSPLNAADLANGKEIYLLRCAQCHGLAGTPFVASSSSDDEEEDEDEDADEYEDEGEYEDEDEDEDEDAAPAPVDEASAPAAKFVTPRPRDFTKGMFKIRSTPSGEIPSDADLVRVISKGMPGTSMPPWEGALSKSEIRDLVAVIKTFSSRFQEEKPSAPLELSGAVPSSPESIQKGRELYLKNGCNACHGEHGRGDGLSAPTLRDDWGYPIRAANFHKPWTFRGGPERDDIFRTFMTGLNGTPMPSYFDQFSGSPKKKAGAWHIANYLASLGEGRPNTAEVLRAEFRESLPEGPADAAWDELTPTDFSLVGQVIVRPRQFTPSIDRVAARAFYNDDELALLLEWDDSVPNAGDGVAVEVPRRFDPEPGRTTTKEKPYFLLGDSRRPVELWRWSKKRSRVVSSVRKGARSLPKRLKHKGVFRSSASYEHGLWRLVIRRKLSVPEEAGVSIRPGLFLPMTFLAWDADNGDGGLKSSIATWSYLLLVPPSRPIAYALPVLALLFAAGLEFWFLRRRRGIRKP